MPNPLICCVVPSVRPEQMESFRKAWAPLFEKHEVTLITVWDGEQPKAEAWNYGAFPLMGAEIIDILGYGPPIKVDPNFTWKIKPKVRFSEHRELFCRKTDAIRNVGFVYAACLGSEFILTLDDDVAPPAGSDPIQEHLDVLNRRVPISWMNTAVDCFLANDMIPYLRGFPYGIREEAPVMVSHGVWVNVPDFDGQTQLELTNNGQNPERLPYSLPYFRGPVPKGCLFPFCGMNVMVRKEALPYLYFAPMGPDSGVEGLNRFADIWCGILLKRECDHRNWAIYTGASTVIHTRQSDPFKNVEQEKLGIEWNEIAGAKNPLINSEEKCPEFFKYWLSYINKARRFQELIKELQGR